MCKRNKPHSVEQAFRECIMNLVQIQRYPQEKFYCNYNLILIMEKKSQNRDFDHVHEHVLEHKYCNNETL